MPEDPGVQPADQALRQTLLDLSGKHGVPAIDLEMLRLSLAHLELIPLEIARRHGVLPLHVKDDALFLAMTDPSEARIIEEVEFVSGKKVLAFVAEPVALARTIERAYDHLARGRTVLPGVRVPAAGPPSAPGDLPSGSLPPGAHVPPPPRLRRPATTEDVPDLLEIPMDDPRDDAPPATGTAAATRSVLLIDPDAASRTLLRRGLEDSGFTVAEVECGKDALAFLREHAPDMVVLDPLLPDLHGFEICQHLRADARLATVPLVLTSAVYHDWRLREDLKSLYGMGDFIEKPCSISDAVTRLEACLEGTPPPSPESVPLGPEAEAALQAANEAYQRHERDEAIAHLERGVAAEPGSYRLHYQLALLLGRRGETFRAIGELEASIELHPRFFPALKNLAVLYEKSGFKKKSIEAWERALGAAPDAPTREQIKEHLLSLL